MGSTFTTVFEAEAPPYEQMGSDHPALNRHLAALDKLAKANGLVSLSAFESYEPEDTDGLFDEETQAKLGPAEWFSPDAGLAALDALYEFLEANPTALRYQEAILEDLSDLGDELEAAKKAGARFRFAVIL